VPSPARRPRPVRWSGASSRAALARLTRRDRSAEPGERLLRHRRQVVLRRSLLGALVLLLVLLGWAGFRLLGVRGHLLEARRQVTLAGQEARAGHVAPALAAARSAAAATAATRGLHSDPVWAVARHLPLLGSSLVTAQGLAENADALAAGVLPPLALAAQDLRAENLRLPGGGGMDTARLRDAGSRLTEAQQVLSAAQVSVSRLPDEVLLTPVGTARRQLLGQLADLSRQFAGATTATTLAPAMLGADGPRRYFLALQNTAEARGSGGIIGAYGVVVADHGQLRLEKAGGDRDLLPDYPGSVLPLPPDLDRRWGSFGVGSIWRNANLSPHWPWGADVLEALWKRRTGEVLDGVVGIDPGAAGFVLEATGPVQLPDGTQVSGRGLTEFVEKTLYERYPDSAQRQAVLTIVQRGIFAALVRPGGDPGALLTALGRAAGDGRLLVASAHPEEQQRLAGTSVGGALPAGPGPYAALVLTNASGDKLDYYLDREVTWQADGCTGPRRTATLTARLTSGAPATGLPAYVDGRATINRVVPIGSLKEYVSVYGTPGGRLLSAEVDGAPAVVVDDTELGHPVASLYLTLPPGGTHTLRVVWDEPSEGPVHALRTPPLVRPPVLRTAVPPCGP